MAGTITALKPQRRRGGERVNVFVDEHFALSLDASVAASQHVEQELDAATLARLTAADEHQRAVNAACLLLSYRPRSVREVETRLRRHGYSPAAIADARARLDGWGLLDDAAFARYWVEQRARFRPKGARAIVSELMAKGVARETIDVVLGEADPNAETKRAREVIRRPMTRWLSMDERERKRKIHQYLVTRGFTYEVIEEVIAKPEADDE